MTNKTRETSYEMVSSSNKSNYSEEYDDDDDSLGCAMNDYNRIFYGKLF